jgi:hypothetical protein
VQRGNPHGRPNVVVGAIAEFGPMKKEKGRIVETPVEARQGRLGRPVLVVLVASLALVIAAYALLYTGFFNFLAG